MWNQTACLGIAIVALMGCDTRQTLPAPELDVLDLGPIDAPVERDMPDPDLPSRAKWTVVPVQTPSSDGNLFGVWGSSSTDVWVVGCNGKKCTTPSPPLPPDPLCTCPGIILHWDGAAWSVSKSGTTEGLRAVWGSSASDVWAVGGYYGSSAKEPILHWDGKAWSPSSVSDSACLTGVWGSSASDVWAVGNESCLFDGQSGIILHWDGTAWSKTASGFADLRSVWGSGPSDVWAVGESGTILHWDGTAWSPHASGTTVSLHGVHGIDASDVWAVGDSGPFFPGGKGEPNRMHWDGKAWSTVHTGWERLRGVWVNGASDVWVVGNSPAVMRWDGAAWTTDVTAPAHELSDVWGSSASDIWAVGDMNTILHYAP